MNSIAFVIVSMLLSNNVLMYMRSAIPTCMRAFAESDHAAFGESEDSPNAVRAKNFGFFRNFDTGGEILLNRWIGYILARSISE